MDIKKIYEGWKNHILPKNKDFINQISNKRLAICNDCEYHSKNHKSIRIDTHCTNCGCTLSAKTKCLTCECPLQKWISEKEPINEIT